MEGTNEKREYIINSSTTGYYNSTWAGTSSDLIIKKDETVTEINLHYEQAQKPDDYQLDKNTITIYLEEGTTINCKTTISNSSLLYHSQCLKIYATFE